MTMLLRTGSVGHHVRQLQTGLNFLKMNSVPLAVDGIFGPKTQKAVIDFQRSAMITADGLVGPITAQALTTAVLLNLIMPGRFIGEH